MPGLTLAHWLAHRASEQQQQYVQQQQQQPTSPWQQQQYVQRQQQQQQQPVRVQTPPLLRAPSPPFLLLLAPPSSQGGSLPSNDTSKQDGSLHSGGTLGSQSPAQVAVNRAPHSNGCNNKQGRGADTTSNSHNSDCSNSIPHKADCSSLEPSQEAKQQGGCNGVQAPVEDNQQHNDSSRQSNANSSRMGSGCGNEQGSGSIGQSSISIGPHLNVMQPPDRDAAGYAWRPAHPGSNGAHNISCYAPPPARAALGSGWAPSHPERVASGGGRAPPLGRAASASALGAAHPGRAASRVLGHPEQCVFFQLALALSHVSPIKLRNVGVPLALCSSFHRAHDCDWGARA